MSLPPFHRLISATTGPAPCDDCALRETCARRRIACLDFADYVDEGKVLNQSRKPNAETMAYVFDTRDLDDAFVTRDRSRTRRRLNTLAREGAAA